MVFYGTKRLRSCGIAVDINLPLAIRQGQCYFAFGSIKDHKKLLCRFKGDISRQAESTDTCDVGVDGDNMGQNIIDIGQTKHRMELAELDQAFIVGNGIAVYGLLK